MKTEWQCKKLEDVCEFVGGSQPPKSTFSYEKKEGYVRLIQIRDYKSENHKVYVQEESTKRFCNAGDVMIGRYGPPVFQILKGLAGAYNVALMKAVPDKTRITKDFLFHFLQTPNIQDYIISLSERAAGQSGVNKRALNEYPIFLPPIPEQKRIVKILDEAFAAIDKAKANAEKNLQNSRELFDSYLNKVFAPSASSGQRNPGEDWEEKRLVEVCNILNGGTPKTGVKEYWDGNVKWITPKDMGKLTSKFVDDTPRKITSLGLQKSSAKVIPSNSLILSTRAPIGHLAINTSEMATNQGCRGIIPSSEINIQYLYFFLSNSIDLLNSLGTGATFRELSAKALSSVKIPLPPIHIQAQITAKFNALSRDTKKLEAIYQQKLADLDELKKSILQKAFDVQLTIDNG